MMPAAREGKNCQLHTALTTTFAKGINMPMIRNISRTKIILEHVQDEPLAIEPNETVEVPAAALSLPLVRHYIEVKRLDIIRKQTQMSSVVLSR